MATEKNNEGGFIITALSTDGGGIPRNFLLSHGLSLVRFDALTFSEFVDKCSLTPAKMLSLKNKGHLGLGADGDLVVVDPQRQEAVLTVVGGRVVMMYGVVVGSGGTIITTARGRKTLENRNLSTVEANIESSLLYSAPEKG